MRVSYVPAFSEDASIVVNETVNFYSIACSEQKQTVVSGLLLPAGVMNIYM